MSESRKRFTAIAIGTAVLLAIGGGAYAYWTLRRLDLLHG